MVILQCFIHKCIKAMQKYHIICFVINLCVQIVLQIYAIIIINYRFVPTKINFHIVLLHSKILKWKKIKNEKKKTNMQ